MKTYELTYIITPEITAEEAEAKAKEMESAIQSKEGVIIRQSNPVAKTFSYPIEKSASGFWGVIEFQSEPEKLSELKEGLSKDQKIIRHMVTIKKASKPRKERRSRTKLAPSFEGGKEEIKEESVSASKPKGHSTSTDKSEAKEKVELKDIEQELEDILG